MKSLSIVVTAAALVSAAAVFASGQGYPGAPLYVAPPWMQDDGSSSDYPNHMPSDYSGDALNHAYRHGLTVPSDSPPE